MDGKLHVRGHFNGLKTTLLFALMWAIIMLIWWATGGDRGTLGVYIVIGLVSTFSTYWFSDKLAIASMGARAVTAQEAPALYRIVRELSAKAGKPMPRIYVAPTMSPNAFATGRNERHAAVCCTQGILNILNEREIRGVLGHELMHVYNHDILTSAIASALATIITYLGYSLMYFGGGRSNDRDNSSGAFGLIGALLSAILVPLGASLIQMAISRTREFDAAEDGSRRARAAVGILDHYDRALSAILIGNNLVNIASSSLGSVIVILLAGEQWTWVSTVVLTLLVIIFGETMPKIVAKQNANGIALRNAYVIRALSIVLYPVIWLVVGLVHLITRPLRGDTGDGDPEEAASQELQSIIETAEDEDVLDEDRSELLRSALDFSDVSASEAMTARVDMVAIDIDDDWDEILRVIDESTYSRLPVYSDSVDNIIGFLYLNRFFKAMMDGRPEDLRAQLIPPCFVYKTTRLPDVLAKLRREQKHLAVVTDEYGGTLGVITMEDVLEELVGDSWDETDEVEREVVARSDGGYELDGDMTISDFLELLGWNEDALDDADSATVGGWTLERFGTFPKPGDSFRYENLTVTVLAMDGRRVERVLVQPDPASDKDE